MQIEISKLYSDPRNSNVCGTEYLKKLERHIQKSKLYPPLIVRPHPNLPEAYMMIDGHHRLRVLKNLEYESVECQVWQVSEQEALLALSTLNTLRGTENIRKRASLLESLNQYCSVSEMAEWLPESEAEIHDLMAILKLEEEEVERAIRAQIEAEKAEIPISYHFMLSPQQSKLLETALSAYQGEKTEQLIQLCQKQLEGVLNESA